MRAKQVAIVAMGLAIAAGLLAYPAFATTGTQTTNAARTTHALGQGLRGFLRGVVQAIKSGTNGQGTVTLAAGQTFTLTSTSGKYALVGSQGKTNGTASGTLVFTVDQKLAAGYTVSVSGTITVGATAYTISSGSGVLGPGGHLVRAQGALSPSGSFILVGGAKGNFASGTSGTALVDLSSGGTEYGLHLAGGVQG